MTCALCSKPAFYRVGVLQFCKQHRAAALRQQQRHGGTPQCQTPGVDTSKPKKNIVWIEGDVMSWLVR
jgi:hypothetical protein